jgi:hypothetical protein
MKKISSYVEMLEIPIGEKFYVINNDEHRQYIMSGKHPKIEGILAIWNANYETAKVFTASSINVGRYGTILSGKYDSNEVGSEMIKQLNRRIKSITEIYVKGGQGEELLQK